MAKKETEKKNEEVIETLVQTLSKTPAQEETETLEAAPATMFSYGLGELMVMEDLDSRIFYLDEEVSDDTFRNVTMFIIKKNIEDAGLPVEERVPIKLIINCFGGEILNGLGLIDVIRNSDTPVYTIVIGYACSMAFYVAALGDVRFAMPNSTFLDHEGFCGGSINSWSKTRDESKFYDRIDERLDKMVASRSKLTFKQLQDEKRIERYMFADEAKELGIIDAIIGEDVGFEDIFGIPECNCGDCHGDCDGKKES